MNRETGKENKGSIFQAQHMKNFKVRKRPVYFGPFNLVVRAVDPSYGGKIVNAVVLKQLYDLARNLSFRPEIQVRGKRIVAYPAACAAQVGFKSDQS